MPQVTIDVPASLLEEFERHARRNNVAASDVILETLQTHAPREHERRHSVLDLKPLHLGEVLAPLTADDDLLEEMESSSHTRDGTRARDRLKNC